MEPDNEKPTTDSDREIWSSHVGVREAKANLSRLLRDVKSGRDIVITEYGRPIARLVPVRTLDLADRLLEMEARGDIETLKPATAAYRPISVPEGLAQKYLREDREGRR